MRKIIKVDVRAVKETVDNVEQLNAGTRKLLRIKQGDQLWLMIGKWVLIGNIY